MKVFSKLTRRKVALAIASGAFIAFASQASAQEWPTKPVRLVVPFPAGGNVDQYARVLGPALSKELKQPVVIDNRPGATGAIGAEAVASAAPDGYTLLMGNITAIVGNAVFAKDLRFDPRADLVPVVATVDGVGVIFANKSLQASSLTELKALANAKDPITYGSAGTGSIAHLAVDQLTRQLEVKAIHVPYKGNGAFLTDLIAGHIQMALLDFRSASSFVEKGMLYPIAVVGRHRLPEMPEVPATAELGIVEPDFTAWIAVFAPKGTPAAILERVQLAGQKAMEYPEVLEFSSRNGNRSSFRTGTELQNQIGKDIESWGKFTASAPGAQ